MQLSRERQSSGLYCVVAIEELLLKKINRREFVATTAAAGATFFASRHAFALQGEALNQTSVPSPKLPNRETVPVEAVPFPMKNVRLGPSAFSAAADANRRYLKTLPPDRLLYTFRLTAGLPSSAEPLGDWEKPDCELRGHFAGGHYLSACALAFASSNDEQLKRNGDLMVAELAKCSPLHVKMSSQNRNRCWETRDLTDGIDDERRIAAGVYENPVRDFTKFLNEEGGRFGEEAQSVDAAVILISWGLGCALRVPAFEFQQHWPEQGVVARASVDCCLHKRANEGRDVPAPAGPV
jgi:hypothetical protein